MNQKLIPLINQLNLNTRLLKNCIDGVDDESSVKPIIENVNPFAFIVIHLLDARYYIARLIDLDIVNPYKEQTDKARTAEDIPTYPALNEMFKHWQDIGIMLNKKMKELTEEKLAENPPFKFPIDDETLFGTLTFLMQHEAYHIGQLGLLRKAMGLPSMKYD